MIDKVNENRGCNPQGPQLHHTLRYAAAGLTLLLLNACASTFTSNPPDFDLTVESLEVTQVVQRPANDITLVAGKATAVRATLGVSGSTNAVSGVTGRLHVFVNGSEITDADGLEPINTPFLAPLNPDRDNENNTLNFELPPSLAIAVSNNVDFRVDLTPVSGESNQDNNSLQLNNLSFVERSAPRFYYVKIVYPSSGVGPPADATIGPGVGDAFLRAILPVDGDDPAVYLKAPIPTTLYFPDENNDGVLDPGDYDGLFETLEDYRQLLVDDGVGANNKVFLYGWLGGNPMPGGNGVASGRVAFGNTQLDRYQRTFAHEVMHLLGEPAGHPTCSVLGGSGCVSNSHTGWDVTARLDANPVGNDIDGRVRSQDLCRLTCGGLVTDEAWIDTIEYNGLLGKDVFEVSGGEFQINSLVVKGSFDPSGTNLKHLSPVFRYPWPSQATSRSQLSASIDPFAAEAILADGSRVRIPFDARPGDDSAKPTEAFGAFALTIPVSQQIKTLRITDASGSKEYGRLDRSAAAPRITFQSPREGAQLAGRSRVEWSVEDPDTNSANLMFQLAFSPDNGRNFVPVAVGLRKSYAEFDATELPSTNQGVRAEQSSGSIAGKGLLRVFVSDGLNTSYADLRGLSTPHKSD